MAEGKREAGTRVYYFGCNRKARHYMHSPGMHTDWEFMRSNPWGYKVDDGLRGKDGSAALHHKDGWTAMAFVDYSVDDRPGSNSAFMAEGDYDLEQMIELAKEHFPEVAKRVRIERFGGQR